MESNDGMDSGRRRFLARAGKFAVVTPPTVALLLAAEGRNYAYAGSGAYWNGGKQGKGDNGDNGDYGHHYGWYKNGKG